MLPKLMVILGGLLFLVAPPVSATIHQVDISVFDFTPIGITITQGDTVNWTNNDAAPHTSTSDGGLWNTGILNTGQSGFHPFNTAGSFPYHCAIHPSMRDTITVVAPADVEIGIGDNFFDPPVVQINVGETVQWTNNGAMSHTATASDGAFDSGELTPGATFSFTFNQEGVHHYECSFHSGMLGTVVVGRPDSVTADIQMTNTQFVPGSVSVTVGQYVRWINLDPMEHTTTESSSSLWDSGTMQPGDVFTLQANTVGDFDYACSFHPGMTGVLHVTPVIDYMIDVGEYFFNPAVLQIQPGQTVEWMNGGARTHSSTSDTGIWDSDSLNPGQSFFFTFPSEGVYDYHCMMHPLLMKGTIVVGRPDTVYADIRIVDNAFDPAVLGMTMGQNVRWINFGAAQHTTTDTSADAWNSGPLNPGDFFVYHADAPGDFNYVCTFHPGMAALLVVQDTATGGGCAYLPGDINGNGAANGIDVVYGVAYLKGGNAPPIDCNPPCSGVPDPFFAAMDVNGNCASNGIDVTYFVAYLKGLQPSLRFCAGCPPGALRQASR